MNANELADVIDKLADAAELQTSHSHAEWHRNIADFIRQQQAEIEALKDFAIWLTGCGYDFTQHDYFIKCRDELLIGKAQEK
jgi:hypothetical protein